MEVGHSNPRCNMWNQHTMGSQIGTGQMVVAPWLAIVRGFATLSPYNAEDGMGGLDLVMAGASYSWARRIKNPGRGPSTISMGNDARRNGRWEGRLMRNSGRKTKNVTWVLPNK